ncbi:uncharacterized protein LOC131162439 [Malania oleifera]|uniref:uncharacterized protein LOC131162439 n=1 Tax=Malania oleifera TaxID=397392 RepID=UPI0025AD9E96|nr:uncharacterized protein LOC131162439 [Malania oleifera]
MDINNDLKSSNKNRLFVSFRQQPKMEARKTATATASASASTAPGTNRAEAERLLGIAEKLLQSRDLGGSKDFAVLAQETEPLLEGSDQILAVTEVLLAAEKRINNHHDWYAILQIERRCDDLDLIKKQYRRLALLLHPDKNKFPLADAAFKLVADAWAVLSDAAKKSLYDKELSLFSKIDLVSLKQRPPPPPPPQHDQQAKLPVRRSTRSCSKKRAFEEETNVDDDDDHHNQRQARLSSFWTACPYCYILYEYPRVYEGCCLRCQNCQRSFHAALIPSPPPTVPGKEAYYCCWGVFPLGFAVSNSEGKSFAAGFPNWMPPIFPNSQPASENPDSFVEVSDGSASAELGNRRRGRSAR